MNLKTMTKCSKCNGAGMLKIASAVLMRAVRINAGISLREMARRLNFSAPYLSDIERGRRACPRDVLTAYEHLKESTKGK